MCLAHSIRIRSVEDVYYGLFGAGRFEALRSPEKKREFAADTASGDS